MRKPNRSPLLKRVKKLNTTMTTLSGHPMRRVPLPPKENRLNSILNRNKMKKIEQDKLNEIMAEIDHPITEVNTEPIEISSINNNEKNIPINNVNQSTEVDETIVTQNVEVQSAVTTEMNDKAPPELDTNINSAVDSIKPKNLPDESIDTTDIMDKQQSILPGLEAEHLPEGIPTTEINATTEDIPTENEPEDVTSEQEQEPIDVTTKQEQESVDITTKQEQEDILNEKEPVDNEKEQVDTPVEQEQADISNEEEPVDIPTEQELVDISTDKEPDNKINPEVSETENKSTTNENSVEIPPTTEMETHELGENNDLNNETPPENNDN